ncbi:MAG: biotin--[acetyl-CoA-carboxylase] ligase [Melioribacteraceae bacterium]|nr:biotin--[acetyl-CoA-carboxylase] ligase [Melioribacteraceae bacterium]
MYIYTDNTEFTKGFLNRQFDWKNVNLEEMPDYLSILSQKIFPSKDIYKSAVDNFTGWDYLFITESSNFSQFDLLVEIGQKNLDITENILCVAGSGNNFHGFRNRNWESIFGNIHLSILLSPKMELENISSAIIMLSAVSLVETIDSLKELNNKAAIKWVNDIIINNSKVGGIITQAQLEKQTVKNIEIGIGLNVMKTPQIESDSIIPTATSLYQEAVNKKSIKVYKVFNNLAEILYTNYELLLSDGFDLIYNKYIKRSAILGKKVRVITDPLHGENEVVIEGMVEHIGENLQLNFYGKNRTISKGRLIYME